jgi:hypothetical protein
MVENERKRHSSKVSVMMGDLQKSGLYQNLVDEEKLLVKEMVNTTNERPKGYHRHLRHIPKKSQS